MSFRDWAFWWCRLKASSRRRSARSASRVGCWSSQRPLAAPRVLWIWRVGDILYYVNRIKLDSIDTLKKFVTGLNAGDSAVLQVERNSQLSFVPFRYEIDLRGF